MQLTEEKLRELKELAAKATPGPWAVDARDFVADADGNDIAETLHGNYENNASYIACASPDVALALIAEIERLNFVAWHIARIATLYECQSDDEAELDKTMCNLFKVAEISVSKGASWKQRNITSRP